MKTKIIIAALLLIAFIGTFATPKKTSFSKKEITVNAFTKLIVGENIHVVLIADDKLNSITITGDPNFVDEVSVVSVMDKLVISSTKNLSNKNITVFVSVNDLKYLELKPRSWVSSEGFLRCSNLSVLVDSGSLVELKNLGNVDIKSTDDCDFIYEKNDVSKVKYVK